ncbi:MAG TPA: MCE family protein, partial [Kribbella sp.]|nr:MCE family protein [Kribbella sp.]
MKLLDKKTSFDTVRLAIFVVVTTVATALLAVTIGNITFNATTKYKAVFTDAVGLNKGDDIRIAGVKVGQVDKIALYQDTLAMVTFSVDSDQILDASTHATLRYRNLVGNRYIALTDGVGGGERLKKNGIIPKERTAPALDLSVLFNGFKPLFTALTPADVNQFAFEVIKVLQGEGGTIESLLAKTASLTTTLADADQVIGDLITNLTATLQIVSQRQQNFSQLLVNLQQFITGLSQDINPILNSLGSINSLNTKTAGLLQQ